MGIGKKQLHCTGGSLRIFTDNRFGPTYPWEHSTVFAKSFLKTAWIVFNPAKFCNRIGNVTSAPFLPALYYSLFCFFCVCVIPVVLFEITSQFDNIALQQNEISTKSSSIWIAVKIVIASIMGTFVQVLNSLIIYAVLRICGTRTDHMIIIKAMLYCSVLRFFQLLPGYDYLLFSIVYCHLESRNIAAAVSVEYWKVASIRLVLAIISVAI
jgi:hypothetical protein